ncbi:MAG: hypothetical protein COX62_06865 [Deltaproteobacteria bacterium CG_4_10_14_0_2_um_filter_43_8]|nr:MAG: hypothetical protein COV43_05370 [Deltaproteobacteria bacterium CG11_big_fil_rev_8_21_14_0_20_42_23]PJA19355.1 MAG: hypothetical protein COX62_06865 [Deltaproteobacteria bacterium CG_4_10_14_0_2_um_filter_43_8]PJC64022.1 MAG: hypothetical protein CO021_06345 [Deltaproteobacteria bacterium CG_4_9_14_0_2_um_filter_42_21]
MHFAEKQRHAFVSDLMMLNGDDEELLNYAHQDEAKHIKNILETYNHEDKAKNVEGAEEHFYSSIAASKFSGLAEIHPAWMLEKIKQEPPRIIGIILRYLPSQHVRYIIQNLSEEIRAELPDMVEAFSVDKKLLEIIRLRFEQLFPSLHLARAKKEFRFEDLYSLSHLDLETLFIDWGMQELALALRRVSKRVRHVLFNRLPLKDAKKIHDRLKGEEHYSEKLYHEACLTVLEVSGDHVGSKQFFLELGIAAFARAFSKEDKEIFDFLKLKIKPEYAHLLKRFLKQSVERHHSDDLEERRQMILFRVSALAIKHQIDPSWSACRPLSANNEQSLAL